MTAWDPSLNASGDDETVTSGALTVEPFTALAPHYGMLLGVSDFQTIGASPRGKLRLHQAWQHGPGVVRGLGVRISDDGASLVVCPGLAVDPLGREVPVTAEMCLDVHAWVRERSGEGQPFPEGLDRYEFNARLWLEHDACPTRRVPSVRSTCAQTDDSVQYSRVQELGRLELEPYQPAAERCLPDDAGDERDEDDRDAEFEALRALVREGAVPDLPRPPENWLDAFRSVAAQESAALGGTGCGDGTTWSLFPRPDSPRLLVADLRKVVLRLDGDHWVVSVETIDLSVRRTHLPTWLIEELVAEALTGQRGPAPRPDAEGPRVSKVRRTGNQVVVELTGDVYRETVAAALEVRSIDRSAAQPAWSEPLDVSPTTRRAQGDRPARISLSVPPSDSTDVWYRVVLRGTGPAPLTGPSRQAPLPLAGWVGGPPCGADDGCDVVAMIRSGGQG